MPLRSYIGSEPIKTTSDAVETKEQLENFTVLAGAYIWRPRTNLRVKVKNISIDVTTVAGGPGRYPYIQYGRRFPSFVGAQTAGWFPSMNATPAAGSGHYTFAIGLGYSLIGIGGVIPVETQALPLDMYLNDTDYLTIILENYAAGDRWELKIVYEVVG